MKNSNAKIQAPQPSPNLPETPRRRLLAFLLLAHLPYHYILNGQKKKVSRGKIEEGKRGGEKKILNR